MNSSSSSMDQTKTPIHQNHEESEFSRAMQFVCGSVIPMTLRAAVELDLFEIIARVGGSHLSASEIASHLPTQNPEAPQMIERMLCLLAASSILKCSLVNDGDGNTKRLYGLEPICKYFVRNQDGFSLAPVLLLFQDKVFIDSWCHMKEAILEGGIPFNKAHGMHAFEYPEKDSRYNEVFNQAMHNFTAMILKRVLQEYKGFEGLTEVVDVGGGSGATLAALVSKYPHIKGINFDLPHVVKDAPPCPGVEHVGGDMFESVPKGEVIFMKYILHDWSDEHCSKVLRNCWKALPETGKIIMLEFLLPDHPETDGTSKDVFTADMSMLTMNPGGKERTKREFDALATGAGFSPSKLICQVYSMWVFEFDKMV